MERIARIFDYMKSAFRLNKENRGLYRPQIVLILIKTVFFIFTGVLLYKVMLFIGENKFWISNIWQLVFGIILWLLAVVFLLAIVGVIVEAGLFNMYKSCIVTGALTEGAFADGVRKYFIRFLLADLLMIIVWILFLVPFIFIGFVTLMVGFVLIPLLFAIFTAMWKVNMVMEDTRVIEALRNSIAFAKNHFLPLGVLVVIRSAFLSISGSGNGSGGSNSTSARSQLQPAGDNVSFGYMYNEILPYLKIGFYILIPIVSVAIIISSLVRMVFQVFFSLSIFIMYQENAVGDEVIGEGGDEHVVR
jgi:hypothetical protein